jgi:hypothetical protein
MIQLTQMREVLRRIYSIPLLSITTISKLKQIVKSVKAYSQHFTARHDLADADRQVLRRIRSTLTAQNNPADVDTKGVKTHLQHLTA